jgi:PAS domain S-box-containing protein
MKTFDGVEPAIIKVANRNMDEKFRPLLESLPVAIYTCDINGYITFFNSEAVRLWGRRPEIGKDLWCGSWKIFRPDGSPMPLDQCPMALVLTTGEEIKNQEIIIERPDGTRINVIPYPRALYNDAGEAYGAVNMLHDVTKQKHVEEKAARLTAVVQSSVAAIISKTLEGIITSWNPAAERIFGYTQEEMIGKPIINLIPHDKLDEETMILDMLSRGESIEHFETKRITKDKKLIDISLTISPVRDEKGEIIGASKIARDITQLKESERRMNESHARLTMAIEATRLGTWEYEPLTQELTWSRECRKIYDIPDDMQVNYGLFNRLIWKEDSRFVRESIEKAMSPQGDGTYDIQFRIVRYSDGEMRWVRSQGKVYFDHTNVPEKFIGTVLDITEERNITEQLEQLVLQRTEALEKMNEQLQRSNAELAQFASVASHDLQEPLRKVQMYSDRILNDPSDPELFRKFFPKIISASSRMSQLIKDILHYAEIGEADEEFEEVNLNDVFDNIITDYELKMKERNAVIELKSLPVIKGIPAQIQQLFSNLVSNSLKFSIRDPFIRVESNILHSLPATEEMKNVKKSAFYHEISVSDNGIGFEQEYAFRVFEIFQRLEGKDKYTGTGIGLAVCKKIVENHHGVITVNSEPAIGTTFRVILPAE